MSVVGWEDKEPPKGRKEYQELEDQNQNEEMKGVQRCLYVGPGL